MIDNHLFLYPFQSLHQVISFVKLLHMAHLFAVHVNIHLNYPHAVNKESSPSVFGNL